MKRNTMKNNQTPSKRTPRSVRAWALIVPKTNKICHTADSIDCRKCGQPNMAPEMLFIIPYKPTGLRKFMPFVQVLITPIQKKRGK